SMKFEKQLRRYAIAEWADNYIDYRRLKKALRRSVHRSRRLQSSIHDASSVEDLMRRSRDYSLGATRGSGLPPEPHQILGISPSSFVNSETSLDEWYQLLELQIRKVNIFFELQYEDLECQVVETEKLV
ncbi:hypothetical protein FOZ62_013513, partial [Perkinsus olseni]